MDAPQTKPLNNPLNNPSSLSPRELEPEPDANKIEREGSGSLVLGEVVPLASAEHLIAKRGVSSDAVPFVRDWITEVCQVRGPGWWITADRNGTLDEHIRGALAAFNDGRRIPSRLSPADERVADGMSLYRRVLARENAGRHVPYLNPAPEGFASATDPSNL